MRTHSTMYIQQIPDSIKFIFTEWNEGEFDGADRVQT